jgi:hypothetical protein
MAYACTHKPAAILFTLAGVFVALPEPPTRWSPASVIDGDGDTIEIHGIRVQISMRRTARSFARATGRDTAADARRRFALVDRIGEHIVT